MLFQQLLEHLCDHDTPHTSERRDSTGERGIYASSLPKPKYSMISQLVLYSFVFLWGGGCVCAAQAMYSTEREFGPVRFSQEQLLELVDRLRVYAEQQGPTTADSDDARHTLSLSDGQSTLRITEEISMETLGSAPPVVTSVSYEYRNRTGVISSITVRLWDMRRTVEISGRSRDQVEAAASVASTIISQAETIVGGSFQRGLGGILLLTTALFLSLTTFGVYPLSLVLKIIGLFLNLSVWLFPWDEWLPGSAVYRDDASFFVRHAATFSFLGFIATIVTIFYGLVRILAVFKARWKPK